MSNRLLCFLMLVATACAPAIHASPSETPAPAPTPRAAPKILFATGYFNQPGDVDADPAAGPRPALLGPDHDWTPQLVVLEDGTFALYNLGWWNESKSKPFLEGRLSPSDLAILTELVRTAHAKSEALTCDPNALPLTRIVVGDAVITLSGPCDLGAEGFRHGRPVRTKSLVPGRIDHLMRVATNMIQLASGGAPTAPGVREILYATRSHSLHVVPVEDVETLRITRDGHWRKLDPTTKKTTEGMLSPAELATLTDKIRETHLDSIQFEIVCEAIPTEESITDLGLAGSVSFSHPCGGSAPGPELNALYETIGKLFASR